MSEEDQALVREAYGAYSRGDTARLLELAHPDLEWTYLDSSDADPKPQACRGRGQLEWALGRQARQGLSSQLEELAGSGDKIMVVVCTRGLDQHRAWRN